MTPAGRAFLALLAGPAAAAAQQAPCNFSKVPGVIWWGAERHLTAERIAAYAAPILWFSPDEPSLQRTSGPDIRIPEPIPGELLPDRPVLYYLIDRIRLRPGTQGSAVVRDSAAPGRTRLELSKVAMIHLSFFAHYNREEGLGAHPHDIEPAEFRLVLLPHTWSGFAKYIPGGARCPAGTMVLVVVRVTAKAHALVWFWSVLDTDDNARFPMHLLVEEGKHALATDKNGDGVFTPGYDVNERINDAWGTRDIISTGTLFTGGYEGWMAKVRRPEHRIFPPLPDDSPLKGELALLARGVSNVVYELRPFPPLRMAGDDHNLHHLMEDKSKDVWPEESALRDAKRWGKAIEEGGVLKSLSIAFRADGELGLVWSFPFFIVKHLEEPMTGGYILQRMYLMGAAPNDFGWTALYTPSASRWLDTYISLGGEHHYSRDTGAPTNPRWDFVMETGIKFRVNMTYTPLKFLTVFTDYWGLRVGIKNRGFFDIDHLTYVLEFGAGSF